MLYRISFLLVFICYCAGNVIFAKGINTSEPVDINGIKQYITLKGNDDTKPLLLFIHGGPGRSLMPFSESFTGDLQQHFIVVQWDQRETGETKNLNPTDKKLTVKLMLEDAHEMVVYLLKKLGREKLYLASHSWGAMQGFYMADKYPQLLHAYIPISPVTDQVKSAELMLKMLKAWAKENNNTPALKELATVNIPYNDKEQLFIAQKWLFLHNDVDFAKEDNFRDVYYEWMDIWFKVWRESTKINPFKTMKSFNCPIYFIAGSGDNQTFHSVTKDYYELIHAPKKDIFWCEESGHTIFNSEPGKLQRVIIEYILPQTR